jgi:hypothetical protein
MLGLCMERGRQPVFLPNSHADKSSVLCLSQFTRCVADLAHSDSPLLLARRPTTRDHRLPTNCHAAKLNATRPPQNPPPNPTPTAPAHHLQPKHGLLQPRANTHHQPLRPSLLISSPSHHCTRSQSACPDRLHKRTPMYA